MPKLNHYLLKILATSFILSCFGGAISVQAGCHQSKSVGWFINKESGERSKNFSGVSTGCGNIFTGFEKFRSKEFSASWEQCFEPAISCELPRVLFIHIIHGSSDSKYIGKAQTYISKGYRVQCVKEEHSNIKYCWKLWQLKSEKIN